MMHRKKRLLLGLLLLLFAIFAAAVLSIGIMGYQLYRDSVDALPLVQAVEQVQEKENYTPLAQLPEAYLEAVVAVEDQRFYQHNGIDLRSILRAAWTDLKAMAFVEGGSTITQQLAKNIFFTQEKRLTRKVAEVFAAWEIEKNYSKNDILELYVNTIYFGDGYTGVYDASIGFFGKAPAAMDEYEATLLAGVPQAPSVYAPTINPELARQRQRQVAACVEQYRAENQ